MTAPGWYPDPLGGSGTRYWNGSQWDGATGATPPENFPREEHVHDDPTRSRLLVPGLILAVVILAGALLMALWPTGDSHGPAEADESQSATPTASAMSPAEAVAAKVKESMQRKFDTDPDFAKHRLKVIDVALVHKTGNEYKGFATVLTASGDNHEVSVNVTDDGENTIWESPPGAFLFVLQDSPTSPTVAAPAAPAAPIPAPSGGAPLPMAADGRVYIVTRSGKTRCRISTSEVDCQSPFIDAPLVYGQPANGITFTANGDLTYVVGDLGDIRATKMEYRTYRVLSWTIDATSSGTTFTHNGTGRSISVSITSVQTN